MAAFAEETEVKNQPTHISEGDASIEERERQSRELKEGLHPLKHKFVFWYTCRTPGTRTQTSYEDNIKKIVDFSSVEDFWVCYCHLARPSSLPSPTDLNLFKDRIRPLWEDSANCNGGKWIIRFKKPISGRFWEDLVLALVGDQLDYGENICVAVLSVRFSEDILSVWNRNSSDHQAVMGLRDSIKRHLQLPNSYVMEYKPHNASVTVELDLDTVVRRLKVDLNVGEENSGDTATTDIENKEEANRKSTRQRREAREQDYVYY